MKLSAKIAIAFIVVLIGSAGYVGIEYYKAANAPDPYGMLSDLQSTPSNTYDITDETMKDALYCVIDAGEGEAIYIKSGKTDILIDTGSEKDGKAILDVLTKEIDDGLDYLVITSPSYRRIGGVKAICDALSPANIIACDLGDKQKEIESAVGSATIQEGKTTTISLSKNSSFTIFKPEVSSKDPLDQSLMTYFRYGEASFFAESDAGEEEESRVIDRITHCEAVVLSRAGSDDVNQHAGEISASYYIVSTTKETGLPSARLLEAIHGDVYATYDMGTIRFTTNGDDVESNLDTDKRTDEVRHREEEARKEAAEAKEKEEQEEQDAEVESEEDDDEESQE